MRIVGGSLRGRPIAAPPGDDIRPTSDRARESIFNILSNRQKADGTGVLPNAAVLDGFCGTGAFGIEALSRGARHVWLLDRNIGPAQRNVDALGIADRATLLRGDMRHPPAAPESMDVVFLDPPYDDREATPTSLAALADCGWIGNSTLIIIERPAAEQDIDVDGFEAIDRRRYGAAAVLFMKRATG